MFFFPITFIIFIYFILLLPVLFFLGYFHIATLGFERLGISSSISFLILILMLAGSGINIPLTKKKTILRRESSFFELFQPPKIETSFIAINLGGAIIPTLISFYLLFESWQRGFNLWLIFAAIILMTIISKLLAKPISGRGIIIPAFIPPIFSAIISLVLAPAYPAVTAFVSGVLGTLIGADLLNLGKLQKRGTGIISIGGAGVFDGIFLVGIISALLTAL